MTSIIFVVAIALSLVNVISASGDLPACNSLKLVDIDFQWLIRSSPFKLYRSTLPDYQCGKVVFVGPEAHTTGYSGTAIIILGNYTLSYQHTIVDKTLFDTLVCSNDVKDTFRTVYVNSKFSRASLCVVICNKNDATAYDGLICSGRTSQDEADIQRFLNSNLKRFKGIYDLQCGCPEPPYCHSFTN